MIDLLRMLAEREISVSARRTGQQIVVRVKLVTDDVVFTRVESLSWRATELEARMLLSKMILEVIQQSDALS